MKIAALQLDIAWEDPEQNFRRLQPWILLAAQAGARFLALPEMYSYGFSMATDRIAEPPDGPSTRFLQQQATEHGLWIAGSLPERLPGEERPANTLVMAGPNGELSRYRKIHPFSYAEEDRHYRPGCEHVTVDLEGLRLTLFVCYDLRFADEFWATAPGTDAYLVVANWPETRRRHWIQLLTARAIENQAYVVGVNRAGEGGGLSYAGDSRIIDPMGETLAAAAWGETLLLANLHPARVTEIRRELPFLDDRRPLEAVASTPRLTT